MAMPKGGLCRAVIGSVVVMVVLSGPAFSEGPKPKYGPEAKTVSLHHDYFRKNKAPDFWALMPYYAGQMNDRACSTATLAMLVNAARAGRSLTSDDELATQEGILQRSRHLFYKSFIQKGTEEIVLAQLGPLLEEAMSAYGVQAVSTQTVHADVSEASARQFHELLVNNEKGADDFLVVNFIQGVLTGDAPAGHIAPIGAYDAKQRKVLILDPDRRWYEPYWVSESTLLKAMATRDNHSGKNRGYVWVKIKQ